MKEIIKLTGKRLITDLEILEYILKNYEDKYKEIVKKNESNYPEGAELGQADKNIMIKIDSKAIAKELSVSHNILLSLLVIHINKKYELVTPRANGNAPHIKEMFRIIHNEVEVDYAMLYSVVAKLKDDDFNLKLTRAISIVAIIISIIALFR